jgi:hypothetical protein
MISYTEQEIFNIVARHLILQGERSILSGSRSGLCLYRGPDGKKCAGGVLIPDDRYLPVFEGAGWSETGTWTFEGHFCSSDTRDKFTALINEIGHINLVSMLQNIHDLYLNASEWPEKLRGVASRYKLDPSSVDRALEERQRSGLQPL